MKQLIYLIALSLLPFSSYADGDHGDVSIKVLVQSDKSWNGDKLPAYPEGDPMVSVVKVTIPPHTKLKWHTHPCINAGYLISGEVTVTTTDGVERLLKAGEGLIELVDKLHYGRNDGDVPAEIVVIYAGVKDMPLAVIKKD